MKSTLLPILVCLISFVLAPELQAQLDVQLAELVNADCSGLSNGSIRIEASGGTEPYTYVWSNDGQNEPYQGNLEGGFYFVTVSDANGNSLNKSYFVNQPTTLVAYFSEAVHADGDCNGSATLKIDGGTAPYTWNGATVPALSEQTDLCPGVLAIPIRDAAGCSSAASTKIEN